MHTCTPGHWAPWLGGPVWKSRIDQNCYGPKISQRGGDGVYTCVFIYCFGRDPPPSFTAPSSPRARGSSCQRTTASLQTDMAGGGRGERRVDEGELAGQAARAGYGRCSSELLQGSSAAEEGSTFRRAWLTRRHRRTPRCISAAAVGR